MNITIISNILPYPLVSGGAQAQFNMIDELRKKHRISFIFTEDAKNKISGMRKLQELWPEVTFYPYSYIKQLCNPKFVYEKTRRALQLIFTPKRQTFIVERTLRPYGVEFSKDFIRFVNNVITNEKADIIQIEFFPCLHLINYLSKDTRKIFVHHEIRFVRNRRLLSSLELTEKQKKYEAMIKRQEIDDLNKFDEIITLTDKDKEELKANGVKVPIYSSPAAVNATISPYSEWNGTLSFVGGYAHIPNQEGIDWLIAHVLPLLNNSNLRINIIGKGWPNKYKTNNINLCGFVPDLSSALKSTIMIVPILTGSGMRMKILEAAAMSLPIITTTVGVEGLYFKHQESCIIADTPEEFVSAIKLLSENPELRKKIGTNACKVYSEKYSKQALAKLRDSIYN